LSDFNGSLASGDAWVVTAGKDFGVTKNGALYANSGTIGGWEIDSEGIYFARGVGSIGNIIWHGAGMLTGKATDIAFYAGSKYEDRNSALFKVTHDGSLYASKGYIGGDNGWAIDVGKITTGDFGESGSFHMYSQGHLTTDASSDNKYFGQEEDKTWKLSIGNNFGVTSDGYLCAVGADL
jgi:hypothetical protein